MYITHGMSKTKIYHAWQTMKHRCYGKNHPDYKHYGEKGITVCDRWLKFENFYEDMGDAPKGFTLDRIDNLKGYSKDNCRWVDLKTQARNKGNNKKILFNGSPICIAELAEKYGVHPRVLWNRLFRYKWGLEDALNTPVLKSRRGGRGNLTVQVIELT